MALLLILLAMALFVLIVNIWRGFVLSTVWGWLIVPQFGLPPMGIVAAISVAMVVGFLVAQADDSKKEENSTEVLGRLFGNGFLYPLFVLIFAWILKAFI